MIEYSALAAITLPLVPLGIETLATKTGRGSWQPVQATGVWLWSRNPKKIAENAPSTNALRMAVRRANLVTSARYTA